ncbi:MAG: methylenetetrahydrofolate reductase [Chloroflexota bacterium]
MNRQSQGTLVPAAREGQNALVEALLRPRFELVPIRGVEDQARHLRSGTTVTITSSPTRGIENTLMVAKQLSAQGLRVVPHIAARLVVDEVHLRDLLQQLSDLNLREIFVIGGDAKKPAGKFTGALDLFRAMANCAHDLEAIGVAAYPEGHPLVNDRILLQALRDKQPFATYMVTQICFDPEVTVAWLAKIRSQGIRLPVYIGLPGIVGTKQLLQISMKIGVGDSLRFLSKHTSLAAGLFARNGYHPDDLLEYLAPYLDLPEYKIRGLHINTFNQVESTEAWRQKMLTIASNS